MPRRPHRCALHAATVSCLLSIGVLGCTDGGGGEPAPDMVTALSVDMSVGVDAPVSTGADAGPAATLDGGDLDAGPDSALASATYPQIASAGLANATYPDAHHYAAEFLHQHPEVCYWEVDEDSEVVRALPTPVAPPDAIALPAPSGGDDTAALETALAESPGASFVGSGIYRVDELTLRTSADIFGLRLRPTSETGTFVRVQAENVRVFGSDIDAGEQSSAHTGWLLEAGADGFHLVDSAVRNIHHREDESGSAVTIRGASDYHIACSEFVNIINDAADPEKTARANAIWLWGSGSDPFPSGGGVIANNTAENLQSNGARDDAEFFTTQGHEGHTGNVLIFANRCVNAGKRLLKMQDGGAIALSNQYLWRDREGPLGRRTQLAVVAVHFDSSDIIVRNNRFRLAGEGQYDSVFTFHRTGGGSNVHLDHNHVEVLEEDEAGRAFYGMFLYAKSGTPHDDVSARDNVVNGPARLTYYYRLEESWASSDSGLDLSGNVFHRPPRNAEYAP